MKKTCEKKYVIHSSYVYSNTDGQRHFIGIEELIRLYGVSPGECYFDPYHEQYHGKKYPKGMIHLYPRSDGNYQLES